MAKLFPPLIEGVIPAFYFDYDANGKGIVKIAIPFSMNRAVSPIQIGGFALKIKTVQSSSYLFTAQIKDSTYYELESSPYVEIILHKDNEEENKLIERFAANPGQFYKFQLAYLDTEGTVGYYSTVATGKYTTKPKVYINNLREGFINMHEYKYIGFYNQLNGDTTERVYSYRFDVYDNRDNIVATSGDCLHNSSNDIELYESYDEFILSKDLNIDEAYRIKYTVNTINGLTISSPRYRVMQKLSIDPDIKAAINVSLNYDNGYININLIGDKVDGLEEPATGSFLLTRACEDNNYSVWDEIARFKLAAQMPSLQLWRDYTAEQGKTYQYSIQQYNDKGLYSNRILSNTVYVDFEDAFLFDGERQLRIKYNPKVTSLKADVLETKLETIGAKYPFIFRNGNVYYREFPISGLISYQMDSEKLFMDTSSFTTTTQLVSENLYQERLFKMEVLSWLTNGKPKLFRSPSEGNFIIRLMNTSLTPTDAVGRMLHTFNSTAYEIDEYNYDNLYKYGFINLTDPEVPQLRWETVPFFTTDEKGNVTYKTGRVNAHPVHTVRFNDMMPGDVIEIVFEDGRKQEIQIGVTGSYQIDVGMEIREIILPDTIKSAGSMTYGFYSLQSNIFDKISNVEITEVPVQQFIGEHDIIQEIEYVYDQVNKRWVKNPKLDILEFYNINAAKRSVEKIRRVYTSSGTKYYQSKDDSMEIDISDIDLFTLYQIGDWKHIVDYNPYRSYWEFQPYTYHDFYAAKDVSSEEANIQINDNTVNMDDIKVFDMYRPGKLKTLKISHGTIAEVAYQIRNIEYSIEDDPQWKVLPAKRTYLNLVQQLEDYLAKEQEYDASYEQSLRSSIKMAYTNFILVLIEEQENEARAEGRLYEE